MAEKRLLAYLDGVHAGEFRMSESGNVTFDYDEQYREDPGAVPVSLSMPMERRNHGNKAARAFIDGLVPEDKDEKIRIRDLHSLRSTDSFALLGATGRDAAGAVQLLSSDAPSSDATGARDKATPISADDFASMIDDLAVGSGRIAREIGGRFSLAGAQRKVALHRMDNGGWGSPLEATPTTHVIKPAIPGFDDHDVTEAMSLWAAEELGLQTASTALETTSSGRTVLVSRRYDRVKTADGWHRIHQEDICQALSVSPLKKYQEKDGGPGVGEIARLLRRMSPTEQEERSAHAFFDALVFNVTALCTDAHAKNYSILHIRGGITTLAPLYDIASHAPYASTQPLTSAMKIGRAYRLSAISVEDFVDEARRLRISADYARATVERIRTGIVSAFAAAAARVPADNLKFRAASERVVKSIEVAAAERGRA